MGIIVHVMEERANLIIIWLGVEVDRAVSSRLFTSPSRVEFSGFELKSSRVGLELGSNLGKPGNIS